MWFDKFLYGLCNESYYGECIRHLAVRSGEHIGISRSTNERVQPRKDSAVPHHLLNYNYSLTSEDFRKGTSYSRDTEHVLCHENKKYLLEPKESLLVMRGRPSMNQNVSFAPLYLSE